MCTIIGPADLIEIENERCVLSAQPAWYLYKGQAHGARYRDLFTGQPLRITTVTDAALRVIGTNLGGGHTIAVSPDTLLRLWDGRLLPASALREGHQLRGKRGMYVIRTIGYCLSPVGYRADWGSIGGIYAKDIDHAPGRRRISF